MIKDKLIGNDRKWHEVIWITYSQFMTDYEGELYLGEDTYICKNGKGELFEDENNG